MPQQPNAQAVEIIRRKAKVVQHLFGTVTGKEVLQVLTDAFDGAHLVGDTVENTYFRLGQRDVIHYLKQLNNLEQVDETVDESSTEIPR